MHIREKERTARKDRTRKAKRRGKREGTRKGKRRGKTEGTRKGKRRGKREGTRQGRRRGKREGMKVMKKRNKQQGRFVLGEEIWTNQPKNSSYWFQNGLLFGLNSRFENQNFLSQDKSCMFYNMKIENINTRCLRRFSWYLLHPQIKCLRHEYLLYNKLCTP